MMAHASNKIKAPRISNIRLIGCDKGETFHLLGEDMGAEGVCARKGGLTGLWEAPIKILERTPVRMDGGVLRAVKTAIMEPVITLIVNSHHVNDTFEVVDGNLREALSYELDPYYPQSTPARIEWETEYGTRWIEVFLAEGSSYETELDPHYPGFWIWELHLKAYVPYWQEDEVIKSVEFTVAGSKTVEVSNPTSLPMQQRWVGTQATWTLPDNSWEGKKFNRAPGGMYPTRNLVYPNLSSANGGIIVDYDPSKVPVRDAFDHNLVAQMPVPGDYPKFMIPPFTQATNLTVIADNVPSGGAMMRLHQPRRYRRPWGSI